MRAVLWLEAQLQQVIGIANPGVSVKRKRTTVAGPKGSSYTIYPSPAPRGQPPRKRTGNLQKNVNHEFFKEEMRAVIGVRQMARYGLFLELGGWPWFLSSIQARKEQLEKMIHGS